MVAVVHNSPHRAAAGGLKAITALVLLLASVGTRAGAQGATPPATEQGAFFRALDLETAGKFREAVPLYRAALGTSDAVSALLGLERVLAELGWGDSLLAPLDSLIAREPREPVYRTAQLRTLQTLGRATALRAAFERWAQDVPADPAPYREYARILIQRNQSTTADSIIRQARRSLGSLNGLQVEHAQLRAGAGEWVESAAAWRSALLSAPHMEPAASYSLAPTPAATRPEIRQVFLASPMEVGARRVLASLEATWGSPSDGWIALKDLPPDSAGVEAWSDFAERAEADQRWTLARDALVQAVRARPAEALAIRAATASLNAGDPAAVLTLAPIPAGAGDSARVARTHLPLHARALSQLGRPEEAERLVARFDRWIAPGPRNTLTRVIALGWVRRGDMSRARAVLAAAGPEADSSDTAGWLALYEGDIRTARALLRSGTETTPELALALATIARVRRDRVPVLGEAFLALARSDSGAAVARLLIAADSVTEVAPVLLLTAAQIESRRGRDADAQRLFARIVAASPTGPEGAQADLEWARLLARAGAPREAVERLEHLILTYPESALVPQARRELDVIRRMVPGGSA